jgi:rubrerythrin
MAAEPPRKVTQTSDDYVRFWAAGESGKGEYRCSECAYGVTVYRTLPVCPICSGSSWEQAAWSPFSRARSSSEPA